MKPVMSKTSLKAAVMKMRTESAETIKPYAFPVQAPALMPGVVPSGRKAPVMAMDTTAYQYVSSQFPGGGFPGYAYLAGLATRAEFRSFASTLSTELTRKGIEFTSKTDDDAQAPEKIKQIEDEFKRLKIMAAIQTAAEHDCLFGRAQLFVGITGHERDKPVILSPKSIPVGALDRVVPVEPIWTTPTGYDTIDPSSKSFYKPVTWFMLGDEVHASRLLTIVTRPVPDILKPAFNFGGMSLSQLAEPYVDNWLRTRQSVSDLINIFSITVLATDMSQALQEGGDDGAGLLARAELFTTTRSNKGLAITDKEREELQQINTPLSGLHELQAQSQEHMCAVTRTPAIILTGISPSGLNASSDGEIRVFYDWIASQQESHWREPLEVILKLVQLSLFGAVDPNIGFKFVPLYQMTSIEEADIRLKNSQVATAYITAGVLDPQEERERLANDPDSGYEGLDLSIELVAPVPPGFEDIMGGQWNEHTHPTGPEHQPSEQGAGPPESFESKYEKYFGKQAGPEQTTNDESPFPAIYDPDEIAMGMRVEMEHNDLTGGDPVKIAEIVRDHLIEDPAYYSKLQNAGIVGDGWITVKPNGPDAKGVPVMIDKDGTITGGMGGKFNGQKIGDFKKKKAPEKEHHEYVPKNHDPKNKVSPHLQQIFGIMREEMNQGGIESLKDTGEGGQTNAVGRVSSHQQWYRDLNQSLKDMKEPGISGIDKTTFSAILDKKEAGKTLTDRQSIIWKAMSDSAEKYNREHPETAREISDYEMTRKGYEPNYGEPVNLMNLNVGDILLFDGEEFVVKGFDKQGNMVFKDGEIIKVDPFENVHPDAIKKTTKPGKARIIK